MFSSCILQGYIDRQALYACATCYRAGRTDGERGHGEQKAGGGGGGEETEQKEEHLADGGGKVETFKESLAGVCLACSLHCHEGHDLYELYTKRSVGAEAKAIKSLRPLPLSLPPSPSPSPSEVGSSGVTVATPSSLT